MPAFFLAGFVKNAPISHNRVKLRHGHCLKFVDEIIVQRFKDIGAFMEFERI